MGMTAMTPEQETGRYDLSDLVHDRMAELGLSYRRLEELCVDPEADPADAVTAEPLWKRGTLENLVKRRKIQPPDFPRLRALHAGLGVPLAQVQAAAGSQFLGIDTVWSPDGKVRALVPGYAEMDDEDQAKVHALMEAYRTVQGE
ncbi:hypothetical protein ACIGMX_34345 [Streptomyces aquilus]|uniref:hypothetical protein n=1 Tax=Streptomyces aquilus TaxID=2548456 RepID=UPI0037D34513